MANKPQTTHYQFTEKKEGKLKLLLAENLVPLIQRFFNAPYDCCSLSTFAYALAMKTESRKTKKYVSLE